MEKNPDNIKRDDFLNEDVIYKIIAENTTDIIVLVDQESIVRYVSPSIKTTTGYTVEQYLGMDAFEIIHPEDSERVRSEHNHAVQSKTSIEIGYRVTHLDGTTLYVETRIKPVLDSMGNVKYIVAVVRDVTERKKTEQLLENILESINAAVWSTDKDFKFYTFCSDSIEKIAGIPKKEIMFSPIRLHDHIHPDDNVMLMGEVKQKLDEGLPVNQIIRFTHIENETRWSRLIVHPFTDNSGTVERTSIKDNIKMAKLDAADEKIMAAAKKAFAHEFISALPNGYDTEIGERGIIMFTEFCVHFTLFLLPQQIILFFCKNTYGHFLCLFSQNIEKGISEEYAFFNEVGKDGLTKECGYTILLLSF